MAKLSAKPQLLETTCRRRLVWLAALVQGAFHAMAVTNQAGVSRLNQPCRLLSMRDMRHRPPDCAQLELSAIHRLITTILIGPKGPFPPTSDQPTPLHAPL